MEQKTLKATEHLVDKTLNEIRDSKETMLELLKALKIEPKDLEKEGDPSKFTDEEKKLFDLAMNEYTAEAHANPESAESLKGGPKARPGIRGGKRLRI